MTPTKKTSQSRKIRTPRTSSRVDRLSTLPPELLTIIFDMVREMNYYQMRRPICRALFHFTSENLYREVSLQSIASVQAFASVVACKSEVNRALASRSKYFGSLVQKLSISTFNNEREDDEHWATVDCSALLAALPNLTRLSLSFCHELTKAVLSSTVSQTYLRSLHSLYLRDHPPTSNAFDIRRFSNLANYSNLEELDLQYWTWAPRTNKDLKGPSLPLETIASITIPIKRLSIFADLRNTLDERPLATFLECFPNLQNFNLTDQYGTYSLDHVLCGLTSDVEELDVEGSLPVVEALSRFSNLKTLALGDHSYNEETLRVLQACPLLQKLCLGYQDADLDDPRVTTVSYDTFSQILQDGILPKALKELQLHFFSTGLIESVLETDPDEALIYSEEPQWFLPRFPPNFSCENAVAFIQEAEAVGIAVTGPVHEAVEEQIKWENGYYKILARKWIKEAQGEEQGEESE